MGLPPSIRIPDQHGLAPPEEPWDHTSSERDITASFNDAHRVLHLVESAIEGSVAPRP